MNYYSKTGDLFSSECFATHMPILVKILFYLLCIAMYTLVINPYSCHVTRGVFSSSMYVVSA